MSYNGEVLEITNGGMVSCRLRGTSVSHGTNLQAGGNASN